jgi:hypothetical protein
MPVLVAFWAASGDAAASAMALAAMIDRNIGNLLYRRRFERGNLV